MAPTLTDHDSQADTSPALGEPFIRSAQLREMLSVSDSTLKAWRGRGLPFVGGGMTRPRYRLSDVLAWLDAGR